MRLLLSTSSAIEALRNALDLAGNLTVIGGTIGLALAFWALARGA